MQLVWCLALDQLCTNILQRQLPTIKSEEKKTNSSDVKDLGLVTIRHRVSLLCPITKKLICQSIKSRLCSYVPGFELIHVSVESCIQLSFKCTQKANLSRELSMVSLCLNSWIQLSALTLLIKRWLNMEWKSLEHGRESFKNLDRNAMIRKRRIFYKTDTTTGIVVDWFAEILADRTVAWKLKVQFNYSNQEGPSPSREIRVLCTLEW